MTKLLNYLLRRLIETIPLIFGIIILTFIIIHLVPGDPVYYLAGEGGSEEYYQLIRTKYGLDLPLHEQLFRYLSSGFQGDLGFSLRYGQPVIDIIFERIPPTILLITTSVIFASILGIFLGVFAARKPYSIMDYLVAAGSSMGYSIPIFFFGQLLLIIFGFYLGWFPIQGMYSSRMAYSGLDLYLDILRHLVLPAITLSILQLALISRMTRASMLDVLREDYILTAQMKGLTERIVLLRHALRNALLPIITIIGTNLGFILTGSILVETVFAWPGLGRLIFDAILSRDYPLISGMFIFISVAVIIVNLIVDFVYTLLDPRIRYK